MAYRWRAPGLMRRLVHRIGYRGYFLLTLAVVDIVVGSNFVYPPTQGTADSNRAFAEVLPYPSEVMALWTWALAWWAVAAFCLVNAFKKRDHWGFGMAIAIKVAYVAAILYASQNGMPNGLRMSVVWIFIMSTVFVIARMPEPPRSLRELSEEIDETGEIGRPDDA